MRNVFGACPPTLPPLTKLGAAATLSGTATPQQSWERLHRSGNQPVEHAAVQSLALLLYCSTATAFRPLFVLLHLSGSLSLFQLQLE